MNPQPAHWLSRWFDAGVANKRQPAVEGLRALAMSLVFFGHFPGHFGHYLPADSVSSSVVEYFAVWGHRGITFFLVITGYFVYGQFLDGSPGYLPFVKKRLFRICPLYWSVLAFYLVLSAFFPPESKLPQGFSASVVYILENILLLPGIIGRQPIITVSWAISYLVLAYLTIPFCVLALGMKRWAAWRRVLFILAGALLWLESCKLYGLNNRAVMIAAGMLLYEAARRKSFREKLSRPGELAAVCLCVMALTVWYLMDRRQLEFLPSVALPGFNAYLLLGAAMFYFCAYCFAYDGVLKKLLARPAMRALGKMSYSYYLLHGVTLKGVALAARLIIPAGTQSSLLFWCALPACYGITLCTSAFLFALVERPLAARCSTAGRPAFPRPVQAVSIVHAA